MAKKRLGPKARPGNLDSFLEVLESSIFEAPVCELAKAAEEDEEDPQEETSRRRRESELTQLTELNSDWKVDKQKTFTCIISLINQASCALCLKMFTARMCVKDGQVPPQVGRPTRIIRANSHMGTGSSQIDITFDMNDTSPIFKRREYVEVMDMKDLEGPSQYYCMEQSVFFEDSRWVVEIATYQTLRNVDQTRINR